LVWAFFSEKVNRLKKIKKKGVVGVAKYLTDKYMNAVSAGFQPTLRFNK
jgi:hypothetical protein